MTGNGYIEIEIDGRKCGLKFNMYAIEQMPTIMGNSGTIKTYTAIIYAGMLGNAYVKQKEPEFTFEQISDFVDAGWAENGIEFFTKIDEVFSHSIVMKALQNEAKKKNTIPIPESL